MLEGGGTCQGGITATSNPLGNFTLANQGFTVSISDQPCTATGGCPSGGTICRTVTTTDRSMACDTCFGAVQPQDYDVDCGGATGRYVHHT